MEKKCGNCVHWIDVRLDSYVQEQTGCHYGRFCNCMECRYCDRIVDANNCCEYWEGE